MDDFIAIAKALSDEGRVRILLALDYGELCGCQLNELLNLAPSTVSKHMTILRHAGLVRFRKDGRWTYYSLTTDDAPPMVQQALQWVAESVGKSARAGDDRKKLRTILSADKGNLCRVQRKR